MDEVSEAIPKSIKKRKETDPSQTHYAIGSLDSLPSAEIKKGEEASLECPFSAGDVLCNGRYFLLEDIGKGVFSHVFKASDKMAPGQIVVIKIYKANFGGMHFSAHGVIEIKLLQLLSEVDVKNGVIARLLDHFVEKNNVCLVLEHFAKTLCQLSIDHNYYGFTLSIVKIFVWQILVALAELDLPNVQIIHADLKPDNIMIKEKCHYGIKIIDFGNAFFYEPHKTKYIQSRYYRSPEIILGFPYSTAIDMWSVGCIMYELHTGKPLFNGQSELEQIVKFLFYWIGRKSLLM